MQSRAVHAGAADHSFLDGGDGAPYFHYRARQIRDALTRSTTAVLRATVPQLQQGPVAAGAVQRPQGQTEERKLTVEQRRNLLSEPSLAGTSAPAAHQHSREPQADAASAADARAELLAQAERAGVVRKGAAIASRFIRAGEGPPAEDCSKPSAPTIGVRFRVSSFQSQIGGSFVVALRTVFCLYSGCKLRNVAADSHTIRVDSQPYAVSVLECAAAQTFGGSCTGGWGKRERASSGTSFAEGWIVCRGSAELYEAT